MKTAFVLIITAAVVSANPAGLPPGAKIDCAKPNANYCMDSNIILLCNGEAVGTRQVCSERIAATAGGAGAVCQQSGQEAGDAVCKVMVSQLLYSIRRVSQLMYCQLTETSRRTTRVLLVVSLVVSLVVPLFLKAPPPAPLCHRRLRVRLVS